MRRILVACVLTVVAVLVVASVAAADTTWTRITQPADEPVFGQSLEWRFHGSDVVGVWVLATGTTHTLEVVRFTPSRAADAAGLVTSRPPTLAGWDFMDATVLPDAAGGVQALVTGQFGLQTGPPSGSNLVPLNSADASAGPLQLLGSVVPDSQAAVLSPAGPLWIGNYGSTIHAYTTAAQPSFTFTGAGQPIGGCCGYIPRLGFDSSGRLWLALYSNATGQTGIYMAQLDPATGAPIGGLEKAPQSESSDNNGRKIAFACAAVCRVAYAESNAVPLATGRIVTWAPGETAPTVVGGALGARLSSPAIAYRPDGRLWVAWVDTAAKRVVATLGNARGGGGRTVDAGRPPLPDALSSVYGLDALPLGDDVLLNANAGVGSEAQAQYVNVVLPPGAVDTSGVPNPRVVTSPGGKLVYPGRVDAGDLGPGRCVRVKPVANKPARIWAQVFSGRRNGKPFSNRVAFRFTKAGAASKCVKLAKRPAGFYRGKVFRIKFEVRTGANPKRAERNRPPWRTQPRLVIDA